jgi:hypothetical protein
MNRTFKLMALFLVVILAFGIFVSCYGSYVLFHKIYKWNGTIGDKWVKSLLHIVLWIVPVYEVCLLVDFLVFNTLEFWTGKNPLAMNPGEKEVQIVKNQGETFEITTTLNRIEVVQMTGKNKGETIAMVYDTESKAWFMQTNTIEEKIIQVDESNPDLIDVILPNGKTRRFDLGLSY